MIEDKARMVADHHIPDIEGILGTALREVIPDISEETAREVRNKIMPGVLGIIEKAYRWGNTNASEGEK